MTKKRFCLAWAALHFFFVTVLCCRATFVTLAEGGTILPQSLAGVWQRAKSAAAAVLGEDLARSNPLRRFLAAYWHGSGIEAGYGFFAPNVPNSYKLVFELTYRDGHTEYELPGVADSATGLRLSSLLDDIGETHYDVLREVMLKMLAYSVWREHPEAGLIRAVFGVVAMPTLAQFQQGKRESYEFLYAYEFRFRD